jgi:hypothetical protein
MNDPLLLANKIAAFIIREKGTSYSAIKARASEKAIDPLVLEQALERLHKNPMIHRTVSGGDIQYSVKVVKAITPVSHVEWVRANYPPMTSSNDGSGFDIDLSWMFLKTLEERQAYKEAVAGRHLKRERYEHARG